MSTRPTPILILSSHVGAGATSLPPRSPRSARGARQGRARPRPSGDAAATAFRRRVKLLSGARVIRHPRARLNGRGRTAGPGCASRLRDRDLRLDRRPAGALDAALRSSRRLPGPDPRRPAHRDGLLRGPRALARRRGAAARATRRGTAHVRPGMAGSPRTGPTFSGGPAPRARPHDAAALHRPSGDALLRASPRARGRRGVAVVLTGMGRDGADGLSGVQEAGGFTIAQDEETLGRVRHAECRGGDRRRRWSCRSEDRAP